MDIQFAQSNAFWLAMLPAMTAVGAWAASAGAYPEPPQFFKDLAQYEWFRYGLVFTLVYQGLGAQDVKTSAMITGIFYLIKRFLDKPLPAIGGGSSE